jgi:ABC-type nitrate/sulfonate/bicarbonate transport system permease component
VKDFSLALRAAVFATYAAVIAIWQIVGSATFKHPASLFPPPSRILSFIWDTRGGLTTAAGRTLHEAAVGLALAFVIGVIVGICADHFRRLGNALYRSALVLYGLPIVAIAPVLVTWFGPGMSSKIGVAFLGSFFPIIVNLTQALRETDARTLELARVTGASRLQVLWRFRLPYTLPALFAALQIAAPGAFIGALLAEWVGANAGLGVLMIYAMFEFQVVYLWGTIFVATAIAGVLFLVFRVAGRLAAPWHASATGGAL